MEYMRLQLAEDLYDNGQTTIDLTSQQREAIQTITRPELQEDIYRSLAGREPLPQSEFIFPSREMD